VVRKFVVMGHSRRTKGQYLEVGHDSFLPNPFSWQDIIIHSFHYMLYNYAVDTSSLNNIRKIKSSIGSYRIRVTVNAL
jgi:hypothetical protein